MTGKRIALKHPIERAVDFVFGNFPGDQGAIGQVSREQRLPNTANRSGAEHRSDPRHDNIEIHARAARDFLKRLPNKALDLVLRNREDFGVDRTRPIITQISRFDRLKDPVGVIQAYKLVKKYVDCQLVLAGGGATDDPEGAVVLAEVMEEAGDDPDVIILNLPPWSALEINALQRASTVVVQKSLKEGFGLTVTEGLWKGKPVIGGAVGGIPVQIIHKLTGVLVHSVEGCAYQIRYLLTHPEIAAQLGKNGREHVKENFLMTTNVKRWLILFQLLLGMAKPVKPEER